MNPILLIPARMGAQRLPGKPLADIHGRPMILHVWERAAQAGAGEVVVATDDARIAEVIEKAGGRAVMTDSACPTGTDRVFAAVEKLDPGKKHDIVINLQGDMPTIDPAVIKDVLLPFADPAVDIATLVTPIKDMAECDDPMVVKAVLSFPPHPNPLPLAGEGSAGTARAGEGISRIARALYFTRARAPSGEGVLYHHIGIYAFRRDALTRFVALPQSALEQRERLEQLRALEAGMRIDAAVVDIVPLGVDTQEHLEKARKSLMNA